MKRPLRLSFKTQPQLGNWADLERCWQELDESGEFEAGWLFDHFYPILEPRDDGPCFEGWTALAFLAGKTSRLRLGLMVSGNTYRHPALLAKMCATIDVASQGRLLIGIGAAWNQTEHDAYGIAFPPLKIRMDMLEEACEVLDLLLRQQESTFSGKHYQLQSAFCEPKPVQQPRPPIVIGGAGERRTLRIAARFADHWNYPGRDALELRRKLDVLERHCAEVGRDPSEIEVSAHIFEPFDDVESVRHAKEMHEAGCDELILYSKAPYDARRLQDLAKKIRSAVG